MYFQAKLGYNLFTCCVYSAISSPTGILILVFFTKITCWLKSSKRPRLCPTGIIMTFLYKRYWSNYFLNGIRRNMWLLALMLGWLHIFVNYEITCETKYKILQHKIFTWQKPPYLLKVGREVVWSMQVELKRDRNKELEDMQLIREIRDHTVY